MPVSFFKKKTFIETVCIIHIPIAIFISLILVMILTNRIEAGKLLTAVNMLKIIAHPVRLSIVDLLIERKKMTVLEIQEALGLEQAIASQQITLLQDKGVLKSEKAGRNKFVSLRFPKMKNIITCIENCCSNL
jgi:DNA-binding transcriptional ArsR family regulator